MPPTVDMSWTEKEYIEKAPTWCSVDLRDGNQALIIPMSLEEKVEFFKLLVEVGFKEIEVGFPAASETEYTFLRKLIEEKLIPDDVTIQVLTQSREHIIKKTFDALKGAKNAVVHLYNSTSVAQREQVFRKSKEEIIEIAEFGAKLVKKYAAEYEGNFKFEYSPESFTGTEMEFALEICNRVLDIWQPTSENKVIINLPATVAMSMPHVYAAQVAYLSQNLKYRDNVIVSLHPHNDRGCAVADSEMGILAGADRIEGTLFGNGERTGNADIVTIAMNMFALGVDPKLDFSHMPKIVDLYEKVTRMTVNPRQPYGGKLVFAAFSGSHQDAIAKGMKWREEDDRRYWSVPYLLIDPKDVGREYDGDVIRINSQSGKGGIGYIMEQKYGLVMPKKMREDFGYAVKGVSDHLHKELLPEEIYAIFTRDYLNVSAPIAVSEFNFKRHNGFDVTAHFAYKEKEIEAAAHGNGRLDAISNAIQQEFDVKYKNLTYEEHALETGSTSKAAAYISITADDGSVIWGAGIDDDIITASVNALLSAVNRMLQARK
jgi:2-isopropylmalate synthase